MKIREIKIVVISDVHLGSTGCRADALVEYLEKIKPSILILNGDFIDIWQFKKRYWPEDHTRVIELILAMMKSGTTVYYLTGNHDEAFRRYTGLSIGNLHIKDKLMLTLNGQKAWFFHGDIFDVTMQYSKWLARLGAIGYEFLIKLNRFVNFFAEKTGRGRISISKRIKGSVKKAIQFISDFEETATDLAIENGYGYVVCGHIHHSNMRYYQNHQGRVLYLNSGDWIESLTALEFDGEHWSIYRHPDPGFKKRTFKKEPIPFLSMDR